MEYDSPFAAEIFRLIEAGEISQASNAVEAELDKNQNSSVLHLLTGILLIKQNRLPEARVAFEKTITIHPKSFWGHHNLSCTLVLLGDEAKASTHSEIADRIKADVQLNDPNLFGGDGSRFCELAREAKVYLEYGCGQSTVWMANNTEALVFSVETDSSWIDAVRGSIDQKRLETVQLHHINLGETGDWGQPKNYDYMDRFENYPMGFWARVYPEPDLILIDGRFRVACFLATLLNAKIDSVIVFDDYVDRGSYHVVEKFVPLAELCGRQAIFRVPELPEKARNDVKSLFERYVLVMN